jgi:galactonate dehydratase
MRITRIETFLMQAGAPDETAWSAGAKSGGVGSGMSIGGMRNWLFVCVYGEDGLYGVGECSGWPAVVDTAVKQLSEVIIGDDAFATERIWQKLHLAMMGHGITGVVGAGAQAGIDMALWDLKGKALGTPVWNLLGGKVRDRVRAYAHASTPELARSLVAQGYTAFKTGHVGRALHKVAALRESLGPDIDLMVDLHGPPWLPLKDAIIIGREMEQYKLLFLEEPVAPEDVDGLRRVSEAVAIPIAAGERRALTWGLKPLIDQRTVDVIQPDMGRTGITQMMKMAHTAEANFITVAPHAGSLGPVAEFAAVHVLAAITNALILERFANEWPGRDDVITSRLAMENGYVVVPDAPGLGVDIVPEVIARYPSIRNCAVPGSEAGGAYAPGTFSHNQYYQPRSMRSTEMSR